MSAGRLCVLVVLLLAALPVQALDTEIKVLVVRAPGGNEDDQQTTQIDGLVTSHANISGSITTLSIVNAKNPFLNYIKPVLTGPTLTATNYQSTYTALTGGAYNLDALRDAYGADLVVIITPNSAMGAGTGQAVCGFAPQWHWTDYLGGNGAYVPGLSGPAIGLDRRGAESAPESGSFVALVSDSLGCVNLDPNLGDDTRLVVAHEVGHLFGGGHDRLASAPGLPPPSPVGWYLLSDSHSTVVEWTFWGLTIRFKQAIARSDSHINKCVQNNCIQSMSYSASGSTDNAKTIKLTELSVANYRPVPQPPPPCGLTRPTNVSGFPVTFCALFQPQDVYMTQHFVQWNDSCPAATDYYTTVAVPYNPSIPLLYGYTPIQSTFFRSNYNAQIYVSACAYGVACTNWASSSYYAPFLCGFF